MEIVKNEEYVICPRCEQEVYKEVITCPFCNFGIMRLKRIRKFWIYMGNKSEDNDSYGFCDY